VTAFAARVAADIVQCTRCARLREFCERVAREKRAAFRRETYWAKPVPGFGDARARIVVVGLAPAAHGANRTGRMFTGDGAGGSSDFLMAALHANGLASHPHSQRADDGLELEDTWMLAAVRCAPPDNKPTPVEIANCHSHLRREIDTLPNARVYVALGRVAFDACLRLLAERAPLPKPRPAFSHGATFRPQGGPGVIASYHPSRQNTHTGKLTQAMLRAVFAKAKKLAGNTNSSKFADTDVRAKITFDPKHGDH
jgi:uracil-DNA glycosylase family 4